jgi:CDP-diacylglycerol--glycerol-3-phosphate 3-phosphatidyltransferase
VVTGFTGLGLPPVVLLVTLGLLALASLITICQRIATVHRQAMAESAAAD